MKSIESKYLVISLTFKLNQMKTSILSFLLVFPFMMMAQNHIKGNGKLEHEHRQLNMDFEGIYTDGSIEITVENGRWDGNIKVSAESNMLPYIETEVENGILQIKFKEDLNYTFKKAVKVSFKSNHLSSIESYGSGNIDLKSTQKANQFILSTHGSGAIKADVDASHITIETSGSGKVDLKLKAHDVALNSSGSGAVSLHGSAHNLTSIHKGSGKLMAQDFKLTNADLKQNGSGNAYVSFSGSLNVEIRGSGNVYYTGNSVKIKAKTKGSGRLIQK